MRSNLNNFLRFSSFRVWCPLRTPISCAMITTPKNTDAHVASTWTAGIAVLFLGIGLQGATRALIQEVPIQMAQIDLGDEIMVEEFEAPAPTEEALELEPLEQIEEVEIPPLPEIAAPLTPPEMVELTPLEPIVEKPPIAKKTPEPKPRPIERKQPSRPRTQASPGGAGPPQLFSGGGSGRFPSPSYPASARSAHLQGSLRLLVNVEASGLPSVVNVSTSSGHSILDSAARDHVQRRWRWPSGGARRYIVPIRFVLQ